MNFWELSKVQNKLFELFNYGLLHELNDAINKKNYGKKRWVWKIRKEVLMSESRKYDSIALHCFQSVNVIALVCLARVTPRKRSLFMRSV